MENTNPLQSSERLFNIMELLAEKGEMGLTLIAGETGLNKSTAHRFLKSLISMDYVAQNQENGKYYLTLKILKLAGNVMDRLSVPKVIRPFMENLSQKIGETVHLVLRNQSEVVYVDKIESTVGSIRMVSQIGKKMPLYCTAVGKSILATLSGNERSKIWNESNIVKYTEKTISSLSELEEQIVNIKTKGYAIDDEENELGVRCVAVALKSADGEAQYAISISAPVSRMPYGRLNEVGRTLVDLAKEIEINIKYLR